jgi:hypothetical protein
MIPGMRRTSRIALGLASAVVLGSAVVTACGSFDRALPEGPVGEAGADAPQGVEGGGMLDALAPEGGGEGGSPAATPVCPPPAGPGCSLASCTQKPLYVPDAPAWPWAMVTDTAFVYWIEQRGVPLDAYNGNGVARVMRVDRVGSQAQERASTLVGDQQAATALTLLRGYLYWATWESSTSTSTLRRVSATCTVPCQAEPVGTYQDRVMKLVGLEGKSVIAITYDGTVLRFPVDAAGVVSPGAIVMKSAKFPGLAATGTHLYASGLQVNKVSRAEISTGLATPSWATLAFDGGTDVGLTNLATNCIDLFGFHENGQLERVKLDTSATSHVASLGVSVYGVAQDARFLYVASLNSGGVIAVDPASNAFATIASGSFASVAVDSAGVYWADHANAGGGTVTMLVK